MLVRKRDGRIIEFNKEKISLAILKAMEEVHHVNERTALRIANEISKLDYEVIDIEEIQDIVEQKLMASSLKDVAKAYILYRDERTRLRGNTIDKQIKEIVEGTNEYWNTENSNKNPKIASTQRDYMAGQVSEDISRRELLPRDVVEAHDNGLIHFHDIDYFAQHIFNCFRGDTKFISNKGVKPFCAFQDGETVLVPTHTGEWKKAVVKKYGVRSVNKITLNRGGWTEKIVYATGNHRWILKNGQPTTNLKVGDYLLKTPSIAQYDWEELTQEEKVIWCYGFAYGDGTFHSKPYEYSVIRLCGNKNRYENNFIEAGFSVTHPNSYHGDASVIIPGYNKNTIPKNLDEETYKIFIHGLLSADGHHTNAAGGNTKNEFRGIQITGSSKVDDISQLLEMAGYYISSESDLTNQITNYGKRSDITKLFRIQSEQTYRNWRVVSIEKDVEEVETWCLEVEDNHSFILSGGIVTGNCCLVNLEDMLQNGTVINGTMIEKPHSFSTACNIATQIIAVIASGQYGGQSVSLAHLTPFVDISRQKIKKEVSEELKTLNVDDKLIVEITEKRLKEEIKRGVQTIQYQINTLNTSNGQTPFVTVFMYLNEAKNNQEKEDLALIIEEVLNQRIKGTKNEVGVWITPAFPKLIYVLEEDNIHEDSKYYYLTELAAKCSAKRLVPDYISEKVMKSLKEGNCFPVMGCRSSLAPWKDENGEYKFYGRFNQGVVTINLIDVALTSKTENKDFWQVFDERLELCHKALRCRHERLLGTISDISPLHWQYGGLARLKKGEKIDKLLFGGYSSISLGYAGLWECVLALSGKKLTEEEGQQLGIRIMQKMNDKCEEWKKKENIGYSIYGTPLESTTYKFAKCLKKRFGVIKDITDHDYITNSYHICVREPIDAFSKLKIESKFQALSTGGAISYIETPNMTNNIEAVLEVIKYIYDNIMYAELNTKSDYCQVCGYDGEIKIDQDMHWYCPNCGNRDQNKLNVARRTCGYIGANFWNYGRTEEIKDRVIHLDE